MNDTIKLLGIEDEDLEIISSEEKNGQKLLTVSKQLTSHFCPKCGFKMYSRGKKERRVKHPVLRDGCQLYIRILQRRWRCSNYDCNYDISDTFKFVDKYKQTTKVTELLVLDALRDIGKTFADIAREYNISDSTVISIFERHIQMRRLKLPEVLCVDEVYLNMDTNCKYVLVLQDFQTGSAIDLVISRRSKDTDPYFLKIPREERNNVKYIVSDMYNPYIAYVNKYFHNAISVVDSFHVISWLLHNIDLFLRSLLKSFRERDRKYAEKAALNNNFNSNRIVVSDEVYLLEHYKWLILKNESNITRSSRSRWDPHFRYYISIYAIEEKFMDIHPDLREIRALKEEYIRFNSRNAGKPLEATKELEYLIDTYENCELELFVSFSKTLKKYKQEIINSFILKERMIGGKLTQSRLSNGPMESLNRKAKDIKRLARGYTNFSHLRNRFLFVARIDSEIKN